MNKWPDPIHRTYLSLRREEAVAAGRRGWSKRKCRDVARREIQRARSKEQAK